MSNKKSRTGLVSISFRKHSPREILEVMKKAGLAFIEWGSDVHAPPSDHEKLNEIVNLQENYGIACSSYGTYFKLGETPLSELPSYITAAKILGTDILRLWCGTKSGADMSEEERTALIDACREAARIAEGEGVTLCMECHINTFTERPEDAFLLMKEVNSPAFQMYWQPNQFRTEEENIESASLLAPYAKVIHVFNWERDIKKPLREASGIWKKYLAQFDSSQKLLLEFMPCGTTHELAEEATTLKKITGE